MLSNKLIFKMFIKVSLLSFVLTWFVYGTYLVLTRKTGGQNSTAIEKADIKDQSAHSADILPLPEEETAVSGTLQHILKPSFGKLPGELFPGNTFNLNFHRLPREMMTPQCAANTRAAAFKIKELQIAFSEAKKAAKEIHVAEIDKEHTGGQQ